MSNNKKQNNNMLDAFIRGYARNADIFRAIGTDKPKLYVKSDAQAIRSDWEAVGNDMRTVMHNGRYSK